MARFSILSLVLVPGCLSAGVAWTAPKLVDSAPQFSEQTPLEWQASDATRAKAWGLTEDEWVKFEHLQAGPRHYWSPQLDPLTTLGVEADSDQERQRYAELQVRLEAKRAERELAYQKAYTSAWARLFPEMLPVQGMADDPAATPASRFALFVEERCPRCVINTQQWLHGGARLDVYLVGSQGDDGRLRQWAQGAGITPTQISSGQVTLNHDRGRWFALGASRPLPARYQQMDGKWQRID
ncbi:MULTISPECIES: TIGR03759 family integrating conjugative element protein [Pseudomonas]|jgi:integrating conjugative element protein (TIGR03759 family)|uniref:Integrating conjugative element protein n=2 Tax=Pseudomonas putida group TaxID=136845 RepID=V9UZF9_9PSED|nr:MULTISPECIES: TIGR03759 family integrating conjugative element protein [Pseudomonas]AHC82414.1 integrating conjugative element protein [Pseudomonas monteilii SB3078]AHC87792.1 integrating conjugative element protein [Pseudomonas monteilii SB3101]MDD1997106.1 TIGR03759 family integrating conjugative element protein [Pseudomonas putida]MDD2010226.1 TIGR03759 family integrating conjugative element protein [Pseudomonas putida]MDS9591781.1 TIGR03759 family integrating conjugative element protein